MCWPWNFIICWFLHLVMLLKSTIQFPYGDMYSKFQSIIYTWLLGPALFIRISWHILYLQCNPGSQSQGARDLGAPYNECLSLILIIFFVTQRTAELWLVLGADYTKLKTRRQTLGQHWADQGREESGNSQFGHLFGHKITLIVCSKSAHCASC